MNRRHLILVLLILPFLFSCKKYIEQKEEQAVIASVTNGYWYVQEYLQNDSNITASFSGYLFKFNTNGTVVGTKDSVSADGVWTANIGNKTITSSFPGAGNPLKYLNEIWHITNSSTTFVEANSSDTTNNTTNILQLQKQ